ncbi:MAG TPA: serine protease [Planctomycetaceae bacterium]|jgi:hypothetical protein
MRQIRTALIVAAIVTAFLFAVGSMLQAAPVVRLKQSGKQQVCQGGICSLMTVTSGWSGTCVGRDKKGRLLIVSCGHGMQMGTPIMAEIEDGEPEAGEIIRLSRKPDLSLIAIDHPAPVECYPIGDIVPQDGTQVQLIGYPGGQFRSRAAQIDCYSKSDMQLSLPCAPGESGGGVIAGGRLVGVIYGTLDTSHPMARFFKNHSAAIRLNDVQGFVVGALGYQPIVGKPPAASVAAKPAEVPPPKLLPEPHPEPLPAQAVTAEPDPAPALPTHDDIRAIVSGELSKLPAAPSIDTDDLKAEILADLKAEFRKQFQAHGAEVKKAVIDNIAAGKIDPAAFAPILHEVAQSTTEDVAAKVADRAGPAVVSGLLAKFGITQMLTGIGIPTGIVTLAVAGVGFFLNRSLKKHLSPLRSMLHSHGSNSVHSPQLPPAPVAAQPQTEPIVSQAAPDRQFVRVPVADPLGVAMQQAQDSILQQNPGISLVEALPQIQQVAQTILDLRKGFTQQPAPTVDLR